MKVTIHTTRGGVTIKDMPGDDVLALTEALNNPQHPPFFHINLDGGTSTHYVNRDHIIQVDVEETGTKKGGTK